MHTTLRRAFAPSAAPAMSRQLRPQLPWPAPIARPHWRAIASLACAPPSADRSGPRGARGFGRGGAALLAATAAATLASDDAGTSGEPHGINTTWAPLGLLGPVLAGGGGSGGGVAAGSGPRQRMGESGGLRDGAPIPAVGRGGFPPESDPADFINNLGVDLTLGTVAGFCAGYALKKVRWCAGAITAPAWRRCSTAGTRSPRRRRVTGSGAPVFVPPAPGFQGRGRRCGAGVHRRAASAAPRVRAPGRVKGTVESG